MKATFAGITFYGLKDRKRALRRAMFSGIPFQGKK